MSFQTINKTYSSSKTVKIAPDFSYSTYQGNS